MDAVNERVRLRVFRFPCCGNQLCWISQRLPTFCPSCGQQVYMLLRDGSHVLLDDDDATIRFKETRR